MATGKSKSLKKPKVKANSADKDGKVQPVIGLPENMIIDAMVREQNRHWEISDGTKAMPGAWYKSRAGYLVRLEKLCDDGSVKVTSHSTGNVIEVPPYQVLHFTLSSDPGTPCGVMVVGGSESGVSPVGTVDNTNINLYAKYPHIIVGSIYKMQNMTGGGGPTWERKKNGKKISIKGQVRCKIACQEPGCNNERDIKVQDAFQVKVCEECKNRKRKQNLKKFLDKKVEK